MHYDDVLHKMLDEVRLAERMFSVFVLYGDAQQVRNNNSSLLNKKLFDVYLLHLLGAINSRMLRLQILFLPITPEF